MTKITTSILTAALSTAALLAHAATPGDPPKMIVQFADLDLHGPAGVGVLYRRLQHAAAEVCSSFAGRELAQQAMLKHCVADAMSNAVVQVDRPSLTAYYQLKNPGRNAKVIELASRK